MSTNLGRTLIAKLFSGAPLLLGAYRLFLQSFFFHCIDCNFRSMRKAVTFAIDRRHVENPLDHAAIAFLNDSTWARSPNSCAAGCEAPGRIMLTVCIEPPPTAPPPAYACDALSRGWERLRPAGSRSSTLVTSCSDPKLSAFNSGNNRRARLARVTNACSPALTRARTESLVGVPAPRIIPARKVRGERLYRLARRGVLRGEGLYVS